VKLESEISFPKAGNGLPPVNQQIWLFQPHPDPQGGLKHFSEISLTPTLSRSRRRRKTSFLIQAAEESHPQHTKKNIFSFLAYSP
jgi:hypothetical protein